jgi:hypothetical protein
MMGEKVLLTSKQVAGFVDVGFVRLDEIITIDLCNSIKKGFDDKTITANNGDGKNLEEMYEKGSELDKLMNLPKVKGLIESLVGFNPRFDHQAIHKTPSNWIHSQPIHQDAEIDTRENAFDIQVSFFLHDTPLEMGGTRFLPGSHFRKVHESNIGRYQNIEGMYQVVCKAGTVIAWHHNLWHGAQPNYTDDNRYMLKIRLNPRVKQQLLWNTTDIDSAEVSENLSHWQPWFGQQGRIERMQRVYMWRSLTNNNNFDLKGWVSRIEQDPFVYN